MYKVLISDNLAMEGQQILNADPEIELDAREKVAPEELLKIIKDYDALIIRSASKVTSEVLAAGNKLKIIGRAGVGVDNIDIPEATRRGIIVMNTPDANTISTAEHTFSLLLAMSRNIPQADSSVKKGKWERKKFMGSEIYGKILGIIGLGRIGTEMAKRALAFGMTVKAYDPFLTEVQADKLNVQLASLDELISTSDYITVHTPKNRDTAGVIGKAQFEKMKPSARVVNCARGGIVRQDDLRDALQAGKIAGAALDVYESEPPTDKGLLNLENIILTPHLGASTEEAQVKVGVIIAEQILDALKGKVIRNAVNIPSLSPELLKEVAPYLELADRLASFQAQLLDGKLRKITVKFAGEVCDCPTDIMTVAAVKGILSTMLSETLNFVNARFLAKERGIEVIETTSKDTKDFTSTIAICVESEKETREIVGTLIGKKREPYVVSILGYHTDFSPKGNLLVFTHHDEPGIVGKMGTILGDAGINIAALHMGRNELGGEVISILNLDSDVPQELLTDLYRAAKIKTMKLVKL
ncbi:phosphoglycerate dehydrogenase [bacterium]|nr:phosphoglycerate dehydrogenase [bacterium]